MNVPIILLLVTAAAWAQPTGLSVVEVTPTEAAIRYAAPDSAACSVEVSTQSNFSPVVPDVDATLFANANSDQARAEYVANGSVRTVVIGKTGHYYSALNGFKYSRALQAATLHYYRLTCTGGNATGTFVTANIPLGQVVTTQSNSVSGPFQYDLPALNPLIQTSFVDAYTGLRIYEYSSIFGDVFAGSTGAAGVSFALAENLTSGWTASDGGTLVHAISADDNIYAQTSTDGAKMLMGLGDNNLNKYPTSSTYSDNSLSFQNVILRIDCTSCGSGVTAKVALTTDGTTALRTLSDTVTATEQRIVVCNTFPCSVEAKPGDFISPNQVKRDAWVLGDGYVWNTNPFTTLNFKQQSDCNRLRVNDLLWYWNNNSGAQYFPRVTALSCGSTPPSVTLDNGYPADSNGTNGIPFHYPSGIANNQRYGFLIWSDSLGGGTLRVDQASWRAASYVNGTMANSSGGFHKRCQKPKTSGGFTLCAAGDLFYAIKANSDGSLDMRFLGQSFFSLSSLGIPNSGGVWSASNDTGSFAWDDVTAGVYYISHELNYTSPATGRVAQGIAKIVFAHPEIACGQAGTACAAALPDSGTELGGRWPLPDYDATASKELTACLNSCTSAPVDDYSIGGQMLRIDPGHNFTRFPTASISEVQGGYIILSNREASQDSFGQFFAFDVGNASPINAGYAPVHGGTFAAQQIFGFDPIYATAGGRWGGLHTHQAFLYGTTYTEAETAAHNNYQVTMTGGLSPCSKGGSGTCSACPSIAVDGVNYAGKNVCASVTLSSAWMTGVWETQPTAFASGDPVAISCSDCSSSFHYLQKLAVGDMLWTGPTTGGGGGPGNEVIKLIRKNSQTNWDVERGCQADQGYGPPQTIASGATWNTTAVSNPICASTLAAQGGQGQMWDFIGDPLAADTRWTDFTNHSFASGTYRASSGNFGQKIDFTSWNAIATTIPQWQSVLPVTFAGVTTTGPGNSVQSHPSYTNGSSGIAANRTWFLNSHPLLFFYEASTHTNISGNLWKAGSGTHTFDPKLFPIGSFSDSYPYVNISGPGSSLGTTIADRGKMCIAAVANECRSGSLAGEIYFNGPFDVTQNGCAAVDFSSGQVDFCVGDQANYHASVSQWLLPTINTTIVSTNHFRVLSRHNFYRGPATDNVKADPDGNYVFFRNDPWYANLPPFPGAESLNLSTFIPQTVTVGTAPPRTSRLLVEFGYDENFHCSDNRAEACYAVSNTLNESNPFLWAAELTTSSGVPCSSGCSVTIPKIPGRVLRYQLVYRDAGGAKVYASPTEFR